MGRKIPAKKHRGVKDPLQQQARRYQILKCKINAPPKDPDEQPVPRSLTELFSFRDSGAAARKPKRKPPPAPANADRSKGNPVSRLRKLPGESGRSFSLRINSAVRTLHQSEEAQQYPQDLEEDDALGSRMAAQRERRRKKKLRAQTQSTDLPGSCSSRLPLRERRKQRKAEAAQAAAQSSTWGPQYERVAFGDVSAAPPALARPRGAAPRQDRPGRGDLLLSKLLPASAAASAQPGGRASAALAARQAALEAARQAAVAAYRDLNKQKRMQARKPT